MASLPRGRSASEGLRADLLAKDQKRRSTLRDLADVSAVELPRRNDLLPRLRLEDRAPDTLKAPKRNVRSIEPAHVKEVANSITVFGFSKPVLIDQAGNVIDGLVSVEAVKLLGLPTVPCIVAGHLTPDERRLLRITLNKLGENGSWSLEELKSELEELVAVGQPIEVAGFELSQIDGLLSDSDVPVVEQGPVVPEPGCRPVSKVGDVYRLGRHRIACGDARDPAVLRSVMGETVARMIFTDQPYNVAIVGNVTRGAHREFAMASGEMSDAEFETFNDAWI
ncbi:MAG: ParB N-terminal domain-containing protein, partial [Janthinobacterium lividum]